MNQLKLKIMEEIFKIKENYIMGLITPHEFLNELLDVLQRVGAHGELEDTVNETLTPLVNFIVDDILNAVGDSKKQIKDFLKGEA